MRDERPVIIVEAGEGKEDRLMTGSYVALREQERLAKQQSSGSIPQGSYFVPPSGEDPLLDQVPSQKNANPLPDDAELSPF